ncbi:MAG TPA: hypothetical protein DCQ26_06610 [Marinilabiliales bacterium]|jgi:hypothetical protein|nr:MAG: hypothetical protein A2W95_11985 [Bacteroidetes bacterium GWA2_40_14]OFX60276.1 MAG: hypothetical protein A2W84_05720 [Bacteroidetes bacterium GWC2_40_13]OFX74183.1 MAG: hypothetical protein A2W96_12835 [Bacteroidetes bacterium GWD2_40_43]OFX92983.1 MAG: hypothetical protein A2W97_05240 [Bacteroidetes bacterium GWE2_40_63]OFY21352.1 MAG: hypothetical protein A2W88_09235 [Bacteroidetes bacterium GWF2_40_13]OFZ30980.1 MAG: hypothetical protein A2437_15250 [Bacteroidetes bacterium RIFOXYC
MEQSETLIPIFGMLTAVIINLGLFTAIVLAIYYSVKAQNKERMALIEKGVDISEIYRKKETKHGFFKFGVVLMGIGLGLVFGVLLSQFNAIPPVVAYFAGILFFGGTGVLLANYLAAKKSSN